MRHVHRANVLTTRSIAMSSIHTLTDWLARKRSAPVAISATRNVQRDQRRFAAAYEDFRKAWPDYDTTVALDRLRATEYGRLDQRGHVYLDYTGGSLYAESQLSQHMELLRRDVFGNPHSQNPTS